MSKEMSIDDQVLKLFKVLEQRKVDVEVAEKEVKGSWRTNCSLVLSTNSQPINIQTLSKERLVIIFGELLQQQEYVKKASDILGIDFDNNINGFSFDDWVNDLKKRIAILEINEKRKQLSNLESRINSLVSPEQRRKLEAEAVMRELGL